MSFMLRRKLQSIADPTQFRKFYRARRWCHGDGAWTDWQPCTEDKVEERRRITLMGGDTWQVIVTLSILEPKYRDCQHNDRDCIHLRSCGDWDHCTLRRDTGPDTEGPQR
jgi:hypothetical protein